MLIQDKMLPLLGALCALFATGCGGAKRPEGPTYWADVAPIVNAKCAQCHQAEGGAPFALDSYAAVRDRAAEIAAATTAGLMPPYLLSHDGSCGQLAAEETLSSAELATLAAWATSAREEGTPLLLEKRRVLSLENAVSVKTPEISPIAQGGQLAESDEYRCFPADRTTSRDAFITAYEVVPGNPALVHHVIGFLVDPRKTTSSGRTNAEVMQALDASDPDRAGWPCFGLAGEGVEVDAVPVSWAPGQGPVQFPDQLGVPQRATDQLIIQIHYNLDAPSAKGQRDSTTLKLRYADSVARPAYFLFYDPLLNSLFSPQPTVLPPGAPSTQVTFGATGRELGLPDVPLELVGVLPHMHGRGRKSRLEVSTGGASSCVAKVERWDTHWQRQYFYQGPKTRLTGDSQLSATCDYDTTADTHPVLPGWGTRNEMCLHILMLAPPEGN